MNSSSRQSILTVPRQKIALLLWPLFLWMWAAWACAGEWAHTEAYSYGWFVPFLCLYFGSLRIHSFPPESPPAPLSPPLRLALLSACWVLIVAILPLELLRQTPIYWRPLNWLIALNALGATMIVGYWVGGKRLVRSLLFPCLLFFTAIPWPTFLELAITRQLMVGVAACAAEMLNWFGISALASGEVVQLRAGYVGVAEACSGIRSLQTAILLAFVLGEFYRLSLWRRGLLLLVAVVITLPLNLGRTISLCSVANLSGMEAVPQAHDWVGLTTLLILATGIWITSRLLCPQSSTGSPPASFPVPLAWERVPRGRSLLAGALVCFASAQLWYGAHESLHPSYDHPSFHLRTPPPAPYQIQVPPADVWGILRPSSGEYFSQAALLPRPEHVAGYHFFWKSSRQNGQALTHRPDICMPGVGWRITGPVTTVDLPVHGVTRKWYVFPFERLGKQAFLFWGIWCDERFIHLDFNNPIYLQRDIPWQFLQTGQRRFSVEVLALMVSGTDRPSAAAQVAEQSLNQLVAPQASNP